MSIRHACGTLTPRIRLCMCVRIIALQSIRQNVFNQRAWEPGKRVVLLVTTYSACSLRRVCHAEEEDLDEDDEEEGEGEGGHDADDEDGGKEGGLPGPSTSSTSVAEPPSTSSIDALGLSREQFRHMEAAGPLQCSSPEGSEEGSEGGSGGSTEQFLYMSSSHGEATFARQDGLGGARRSASTNGDTKIVRDSVTAGALANYQSRDMSYDKPQPEATPEPALSPNLMLGTEGKDVADAVKILSAYRSAKGTLGSDGGSGGGGSVQDNETPRDDAEEKEPPDICMDKSMMSTVDASHHSRSSPTPAPPLAAHVMMKDYERIGAAVSEDYPVFTDDDWVEGPPQSSAGRQISLQVPPLFTDQSYENTMAGSQKYEAASLQDDTLDEQSGGSPAWQPLHTDRSYENNPQVSPYYRKTAADNSPMRPEESPRYHHSLASSQKDWSVNEAKERHSESGFRQVVSPGHLQPSGQQSLPESGPFSPSPATRRATQGTIHPERPNGDRSERGWTFNEDVIGALAAEMQNISRRKAEREV